MKVPKSWLKAFVDIPSNTKELAEKLTMSGSIVEEIIPIGASLQHIIVGKILDIKKHHDADRLVVTKIDIGDTTLQIVTGADNINIGDYVPVAIDGAVLADGTTIVDGELRGEKSMGMLCSIEELGYSQKEYPEAPKNGIYIFKDEPALGADVRDVLQLQDEVIEFEITSNRVDCQSILGIARETAATFSNTFTWPTPKVLAISPNNSQDFLEATIKSNLCIRYMARVVEDIIIEPSPLWMRRRLINSGIQPINNMVDITNYVLLETGQPLHAFDADLVQGGKIIVDVTTEDTIFPTLDGMERKISAGTLMINDPYKHIAIAGIMGGENSMVTGNSHAIIFESATFNGTSIRLSSKKIGMQTDSSLNFGRGLDPNLAHYALERAMELVELLACGNVMKGYVDIYPQKNEPRTITFSHEAINKHLGTHIAPEQMNGYLENIGILVQENQAIIPTWRSDLLEAVDLSEEVARFFGYNNLESTIHGGNPTIGKMTEKQQVKLFSKNYFISLGFSEMLSYAFESPKALDKLLLEENSPLRTTIEIQNPLGADYSIMRTQQANAMLESLSRNYNRRNSSVKLFEIDKVYKPLALPLVDMPEEEVTICLGAFGKIDFFDIKGAIESFLNRLHVPYEFFPAADYSFLHPTRTASIFVAGIYAGFVGEVHPMVLDNYEINQKTYLGSLNLDLLLEKGSLTKEFVSLPRFPSMRRDLALVVPAPILAKDIEKTIVEAGGPLLRDVELFDLYTGKHVEKGYKSMAYTLIFQGADRTLVEEEVTEITTNILNSLEHHLDIHLRQ